MLFRFRPDWYALTFAYGLGAVACWHLVEDITHGQGNVYSGEFYPWRRSLPVGVPPYWVLATAEAVLLLFYFLRPWLRWPALLLAATMCVDNLGSFLNHRLLMAMEFFLVGLCPVPRSAHADGYRGKHLYWNLDLIRLQLSLVYFITAVHKLNAQFLSGETLHNIFWMTKHHGMKDYPGWLFELLQHPTVCVAAAWLTILLELALAVGLNVRKVTCWFLPVAICLHILMALLMAYIKIFTLLLLVTLIVFLPDRVRPGGAYHLLRRSAADGPQGFLTLLWPGYVRVIDEASLASPWALHLPNGARCTGFRAWVELLSLSPVTFLFAEVLRLGYSAQERAPATVHAQ